MTLNMSLTVTLGIHAIYFMLPLLIVLPESSWVLYLALLMRASEGLFTGIFWPVLEADISSVASFYTATESACCKETGNGISLFNLGWNIGLLGGAISFLLLMEPGWLFLVLFIPLIVQAINLVLMAFYKDIKKEKLPAQCKDGHLIDKEKEQSNIYAVVLGIFIVFMYGFSLNLVYTTTTNFFNFLETSFALKVIWTLGILETLRIAFQTITSTKFKHGNGSRYKIVLFTCFAILAIMVAMGLSAGNIWYILFFGWYPFLGIVMGSNYAESINMVENAGFTGKKGQIMGFFEASGSIGAFIGPFVAGYVTQTSTYPASYFIGAIIFVPMIATVFLIVMLSRKKNNNASHLG